MPIIQEAVERGIARLDERLPNWFNDEKLNLEELNMGDFRKCLLTQLKGGYCEGLAFLGIATGVNYGFDLPSWTPLYEWPDRYKILTDVWIEAIQECRKFQGIGVV